MNNAVSVVIVPGVADNIQGNIVVNNVENLNAFVNKSLDVFVGIKLCLIISVSLLLWAPSIWKRYTDLTDRE